MSHRPTFGRSRQMESFYRRRAASPEDSPDEASMATSAAPLFSPSQTTAMQPRAVSFLSPPPGDGLSTVMFREDSPSTIQSRGGVRSVHSVAAPVEVFFSPASHVSSIRSTSPEAATEAKRKNSLRHGNLKPSSAPLTGNMERFSQAHISTCQSPTELQQTIADLQSQGNYPLLVRAAQKRLYQVQQSSACPLIQEEDDAMLDMEARISPKSMATSLVYSYDEERDAIASSIMSTPFQKRSPASSQTQRDTKRETELQQSIQQLELKIVELNQTLRQEKLDFECSLRQIEQAKQASIQHAQTLQQSLATSHQTAETMAQQLHELEQTNRSISEQLQAERQAHMLHQQKTSQVEANLRRKMQELLQQVQLLQESGGKTEELNMLLKSARSNFEMIKKERNGIITTILHALGQDTSRVQKMTNQDRAFVVQSFVDRNTEQTKTSKSAIEAMQEALHVSEAERKKLSESCRAAQARLQNALADQKLLEEENRRLTSQVRELSEELQQSRDQVNKLLEQAREESEKQWSKKETMFKNTIRILQKQLRVEKEKTASQSTAIVASGQTKSHALQPMLSSVKVGSTVIRPVVTKGTELKSDFPRQINKQIPQPSPSKVFAHKTSSTKVSQSHPVQATENKENVGKVTAPPPPPITKPVNGILKSKSALANKTRSGVNVQGKVKAFVRSNSTKKDTNQPPSVIHVEAENQAPSKGLPDCKTPSNRAKFVRANGGIRGLKEKLRMVRSPTFN